MSQILPPLWAQLQKYYSIQQPHSSWHLSTSYSFYTVTLHLMKYYRQIFLSDRSVIVCLQNYYIMILLTLPLNFRKADTWTIASILWLLIITAEWKLSFTSSTLGCLLCIWCVDFSLLRTKYVQGDQLPVGVLLFWQI